MYSNNQGTDGVVVVVFFEHQENRSNEGRGPIETK